MTKEWYHNNGYDIAVTISQTAVDRAEADVKQAYVEPILPSADLSNSIVRDCVANLAYLLLMKRSIKVTRAGGKVKTTPQSQSVTEWQPTQEQGAIAAIKIAALRNLSGASSDAEVNDVLRIYFKSNFLYD